MGDPVMQMPVRDLTCARCGIKFTCGIGGSAGQCWCCDEDFRVPMPTSANQDCLCPSCLRAYATQSGMDVRQ